jgi:hypothetical protein
MRLKRIRDLAIEILIATVLVLGLITYVSTRPPGTELDWTWIALILNTVVVFGFVISWFRKVWGKLVFWTVLMVLLVVHLAILSTAMRRMETFPTIFYTFIDAAEWVLIVPLMKRVISWNR